MSTPPLRTSVEASAAGTLAEQRIGGAAIEHGRAASAGEAETCGTERTRVDDSWNADRAATAAPRRAGHKRDPHAGAGEITNEIVDAALEAAETVQRKDRTGDHRDAAGSRHRARASRSR